MLSLNINNSLQNLSHTLITHTTFIKEKMDQLSKLLSTKKFVGYLK